MPVQLTTQERFARMFEHREADRVPIIDSPWSGTIRRWREEGMPENVSWHDYFGIDHIVGIGADNSPRFPSETLEETAEYVIHKTNWGATLKSFKTQDSTPEFIDFTVKDADSWLRAKERMTPSDDRVNWDSLERNYKAWREQGQWIEAGFWFGFDVTHSWFVGTERVLMAMAEDPEWIIDVFNTMLDLDIALFERIWERGYHFDAISWPDDMGYKGTSFFSPNTYREVLKPVQKRACEWAHAKGIKTRLHSCGNINALLPDLIEIGIDALNPLEVKAGMDPLQLKRDFGDRLVLHGGINAVLWDDREQIGAEIMRLVPQLKKNGGYIFSSDHSIPNSVSLENMKYIVETIKKAGMY